MRKKRPWSSEIPPPGTPLPDLSDMDHFHRAVAGNQLAGLFNRLAGGRVTDLPHPPVRRPTLRLIQGGRS